MEGLFVGISRLMSSFIILKNLDDNFDFIAVKTIIN
jgi:hypothetical protein